MSGDALIILGQDLDTMSPIGCHSPRLQMNKIICFTLPIFYIIFALFPNWEFAWIFRTLTACNMGYALGYLWMYKEPKDNCLRCKYRAMRLYIDGN
jgi:hypothetical protein